MITRQMLSQKLVLLVIGLAAGSSILIPASYGSFHPVTSSEIQNETIQSVDIKDAEVKASDIAAGAVKSSEIDADAVGSSEIATNAVGFSEISTNAVGASEIAGVSELIFSSCTKTNNNPGGPGSSYFVQCDVPGADPDDHVLVTKNGGSACWAISLAGISQSGKVDVTTINACTVAIAPSTVIFSIVVYDTENIIIPPP